MTILNDNIEVSELFGPTLQGEGPSTGTPAIFLRLRRCNLTCDWCDTKFTWDKNDPDYNTYKTWSIHDLAKELLYQLSYNLNPQVPLLVITGGEPLIWNSQLKRLYEFLTPYILYGGRIEFETNGTISPILIGDGIHYNVSPKLLGSGNTGLNTFRELPLGIFNLLAKQGKASYKFVITGEEDLHQLGEIMTEYEIPRTSVYIMPEATTKEEHLEKLPWIFEAAVQRKLKLSNRMHILAFGDKRGI